MKNSLPIGIVIDGLKVTLSQENDSCDLSDVGQSMEIEFVDAGGGFYPVIKTERWAYDVETSQELWGFINEICESINDKKLWIKDEKVLE